MTQVHTRDQVRDSTDQEVSEVAGLATRPLYECEKEDGDGRKEPSLGELLTAAETATARVTPTISDTDDVFTEPAVEEPRRSGFGDLDAITPLAGNPEVAPAAEDASVEDVVQQLRREIAAAWGQDDVDHDAFAKVSHLTIVQAASATGPLVVADPVSNDEVMLGTREDGVQAVLGNINITAAQALSRAQLALTSERFRTEGINEIHGTDLDKALLALAARDVGLVIINKPRISAQTMQDAQALWNEMKGVTAPAAEAAAAAETVKAEAPIAPVAAETLAEATPAATTTTQHEPAHCIDTLVETPAAPVAEKAVAASIDLHEPAHCADLPLIEVEELPANALVHDGLETLSTEDFLKGVEVTELPADGIPVLTDIVSQEDIANMALAASLKPEVQEILADSGIAPKNYVDLRDRLKSGQDKTLADDQGFILTDAFREQVLKALEADGVTYNAACTTHEPRTVINHQVAATKTAGNVTAQTTLKPEVLEILNGDSANDNVPADTYLDLRSRLKSGDKTLADSQGFILKDAVSPRLLKALEADGMTYNSERIARAPRTVVNYQVKARMALRPE